MTTILPLREIDTVEMTSSLIPLSLKARFKALRVFILEKVSAWTFRACKRVHLLERANLPLPLLVPILVVSLRTKIFSSKGLAGTGQSSGHPPLKFNKRIF